MFCMQRKIFRVRTGYWGILQSYVVWNGQKNQDGFWCVGHRVLYWKPSTRCGCRRQNQTVLRHHTDPGKRLVDTVRDTGCIGGALQLVAWHDERVFGAESGRFALIVGSNDWNPIMVDPAKETFLVADTTTIQPANGQNLPAWARDAADCCRAVRIVTGLPERSPNASWKVSMSTSMSYKKIETFFSPFRIWNDVTTPHTP